MDGEGIAWGTDVQFEAPKPTMAEIAASACVLFSVTMEDLKSPSRKARLAGPRQAAMAVTRRLTGHSFPMIGRFYNRDWSTVIFANNKWQDGKLAQADELFEFLSTDAFKAAVADAAEERRKELERLRAEKAASLAKQIEIDSATFWRRETGFLPPIMETGRCQVRQQ